MSLNYTNLSNPPRPERSLRRNLLKAVKISLPILIVLGVIVSAAGLWTFSQYQLVKKDVDSVSQRVGLLKVAAEKQNIAEVKKQNGLLRGDLQELQTTLAKYPLAAKIPVVRGYYSDANHIVKAGLIGTEAGDIGLEAITPFADVLGLEGHKSDVNAEQKAQVVVRDAIPKLLPKIDLLSNKLELVKAEIDQVDPKHYPPSLKVKGLKVRDLLFSAKKELATAEALIPEIKPVLTILPAIAGEPTEKNYLIIFQNDKQLRPSGGFITSYALAKVRGGRLANIFSEDIYKLEDRQYRHDIPPDFLQKYLKQTEWGIRDANVFPDYRSSAEYFEKVYHRIPGTAPKTDGVIGVDTEFVRRLLAVTGPVKSKKLNDTFSAENNSLGIPDVTYKLELYSEKVFQNDKNRKGFISEIMNEIISKVSGFPPEKFEPFLTTIYQAAQEKHLLFYFDDPAAQALVEKYNLAGRIQDYDKDYLHVNNSNFGGLKSNLYVKFKIDQDIQIAKDGVVTKKVTTITNHTGKGDAWLSSIYPNWQRLMVPSSSKLIDQKVQYYFTEADEFGKHEFRSYSRTLPLKFTTATYTYQLPFKIKKGEKYRLLMQKQPGDIATACTIKINDKVRKEFDLTKDTELEFSLD